MLSESEAQARLLDHLVLATIPALQARYGKNWEDKVNRTTLNIAHPNHCIVGQIEGNWNEVWPALQKEGVTREQVPALVAPEGLSLRETFAWYRRATCAWQRMLLEPRAAA